MKITWFKDRFDNVGVCKDYTWPKLLELLEPQTVLQKTDPPLFAPAAFDGQRSKHNVTEVTAAVFDLDDVSEEDYHVIYSLLEATRLNYLLCSSFSHHPHKPKLRVIIPFEEALPIKEHSEWSRGYWFSAVQKLDLDMFVDGSAKDPSRMYYIPSHHPDAADPGNIDSEIPSIVFLHRSDRKFLSTGDLPEPIKNLGEHLALKVTDSELYVQCADYATQLKRNQNKTPKEVGKRLERMLAGEQYAMPGAQDKILSGRDNATYLMATFLAERFPRVAPESLASLFIPSLTCMEDYASGAPTFEIVRDKIERKQEDIARTRKEKEEQAERDRAEMIKRAFGTGRDYPYTEEELASFGDLAHKWIILHNNDCYLRLGDSYSEPVRFGEPLQIAGERDLSPALHVCLDTIDVQGNPVQKSPKEMVRQYGDVADRVVYNAGIVTSRFENKTLSLAKPKMTRWEPTFHERVDRWIDKLGGEVLKDWLAMFPDLTSPLAGLYICNAAGVGKSLLAGGLVKLWGDNAIAVDPKLAFGRFTTAFLDCPFIFADEELPDTVRTTQLREIIQSRDRQIDVKLRAPIKQVGHLRIMFAANNPYLIQTKERLTTNDIHAIDERFLFIEANGHARKYLELLAGKEDLDLWRSEGHIIKHVLWLAQERQPEKYGRFLYGDIEPKHKLGPVLALSSIETSLVLDWCLRFLVNPALVRTTESAGDDDKAEILETGILVSANKINSYWNDVMEGGKRLPTLAIAQALDSVADKEGHRFLVPKRILHMYNNKVGVTSTRTLDRRLQEHSK